MINVKEAFVALENLDAEGRKALRLAGAMWEKAIREAMLRADRAEWLLARHQAMAALCGFSWDLRHELAQWKAEHAEPPWVLRTHYLCLLSKKAELMVRLRTRLDRALDARRRAESRAEAAEAELKRLAEGTH